MLDIEFLFKASQIRQHTLYEVTERTFLKDVLSRLLADARQSGYLVSQPRQALFNSSIEESLFGSTFVILDWTDCDLTPKQVHAEQALFLKALQNKSISNRTISIWDAEAAKENPDFPAHKKASSTILLEPKARKQDLTVLFEYLFKTTNLLRNKPAQPPEQAINLFVEISEGYAKGEAPLFQAVDLFQTLAVLCFTDSGEFDLLSARKYAGSEEISSRDSIMELLFDLIGSKSSRHILPALRSIKAMMDKGSEQRAIVGLLFKILHDLISINSTVGVSPEEAGFSQFQAKRLERYRSLSISNLINANLALSRFEPTLNTTDSFLTDTHRFLLDICETQ